MQLYSGSLAPLAYQRIVCELFVLMMFRNESDRHLGEDDEARWWVGRGVSRVCQQ